MRRVMVAVLLFSLTACASMGSTTQKLEVSGETLVTTAKLFEAVSAQIVTSCVAKTLTVATCDDYRRFQIQFKALYPAAQALWETADRVHDQPTLASASAAILSLGARLAAYAKLVGLGG